MLSKINLKHGTQTHLHSQPPRRISKTGHSHQNPVTAPTTPLRGSRTPPPRSNNKVRSDALVDQVIQERSETTSLKVRLNSLAHIERLIKIYEEENHKLLEFMKDKDTITKDQYEYLLTNTREIKLRIEEILVEIDKLKNMLRELHKDNQDFYMDNKHLLGIRDQLEKRCTELEHDLSSITHDLSNLRTENSQLKSA